jgi:hypothetical protein
MLEKLLKAMNKVPLTSIEQLSIVSILKTLKSYFWATLVFLPLSKITPEIIIIDF